jgi:hypothetical protein
MEENKEKQEQGNKKAVLIASIIGFIVGFTLTVVIGIICIDSKYEKEDDKTTSTTTKETSTTTTTTTSTTTTTKAVEVDNGHKDYEKDDTEGKDTSEEGVIKNEDYELKYSEFSIKSLKIGNKTIKNPNFGEIFGSVHRYKYFILIAFYYGLDGGGAKLRIYDYDGNQLYETPEGYNLDGSKLTEKDPDKKLIFYRYDYDAANTTLTLNYYNYNYNDYYYGYEEGSPVPEEYCNAIKKEKGYGKITTSLTFENGKLSKESFLNGEKANENEDIKDVCMKEYKIDITK